MLTERIACQTNITWLRDSMKNRVAKNSSHRVAAAGLKVCLNFPLEPVGWVTGGTFACIKHAVIIQKAFFWRIWST